MLVKTSRAGYNAILSFEKNYPPRNMPVTDNRTL